MPPGAVRNESQWFRGVRPVRWGAGMLTFLYFDIKSICMAKRGHRPLVALGLLGPTLDQGKGGRRWDRWRPSVDLCRHPDLVLDRFELLVQGGFTDLADTVVADASSVSPETEVRAHLIDLGDPWEFQQVYAALHDFAGSYPFRPEDEDYLLHISTGTHVAQICLFLLAESRHMPAKLIQTSPPRGRVRGGQGAGTYRIIDLDLSRYDQIASRFQARQEEGLTFLKAGIETRNRPFNDLIERIERVAIASRSPVLLAGPTGVGKTRLARRIYELKRARRQVEGAFVEVNCATLRGDMAMSTLFGHREGAFTGAIRDRDGLLRGADRGVLFLDEIGELGLDEQAMLLRALEDRRFSPMGAEQEVESEFQLIAGTNRDLRRDVAKGRFRDDLLARIDVWTFELPSLRARPEDMAPNLDFELERWAGRTGRRVTFNREAREAYLDFAQGPEGRWPGNFRDLAASMERMATLADGARIDETVVSDEVGRLRQGWAQLEAGGLHEDDPLVDLLSEAERAAIDPFDLAGLREVVRTCRASRSLSEAGRRLFAVSRTRRKSVNDADRIRKVLARHGLDWDAVRG